MGGFLRASHAILRGMRHYMLGVLGMVSLPVLIIGACLLVYPVWWLVERIGKWLS
jgi:hypothetical protein